MTESRKLWVVLQWGDSMNGEPKPLSAHYSLEAARARASEAANAALPVTIAETVPQTVHTQPAFQARTLGRSRYIY